MRLATLPLAIFAPLLFHACAGSPRPRPESAAPDGEREPARAPTATPTGAEQPAVVAAVPLPSAAPQAKVAAADADAIRKATAAAVLRVRRVDEECSGAGGTHLTLELVELVKGEGYKLVAAGGHAFRISAKQGDLFVAAVEPLDRRRGRNAPGICLDGLPAVDGYAVLLLPTASADEGRATLREIVDAGRRALLR